MGIISLYPIININKVKGKIILSSENGKFEINEDADAFFNNFSLKQVIENKSACFDINHTHSAYKFCTELIKQNFVINYCIYDCEFDRWMCLIGSEIEWTTQYQDEDIALFDNANMAEHMIPHDDFEGYAVHTRYYIKGI